MAVIKKEVPTGAIDGSNKTFVLANFPFQIDDVFMDGAIYTTFSLSGQVLTLADAPTSSLFVDYSTAEENVPVFGEVTLGEIKAEVWTLLGQKPTSTTFSDARVQSKINSVIKQIWRGRVTSVLDPRTTYRAGRLPFTEIRAPYVFRSPAKLSAPFAVGDTVLHCDATRFTTNGHVLIGGEVFSYTGKTDDSLTGVSGGLVPHLATEVVSQLLPFPVDAEKPKSVFAVFESGSSVEIPYDGTNPHVVGFDIVRSGESSFLSVRNLSDNSGISAVFLRKCYDLTLDTELCPIPQDYGLTVVATLVAGELGYLHGLPNSQQHLMTGYVRLQNLFQFYTNDTAFVRQSIRPVSYGYATVNAGISALPIKR